MAPIVRSLVLVVIVLCWMAPGARAASLLHGDFAGASVSFLGVSEDSATDPLPLTGAPTVGGDVLDWSPIDLGASAGGASDTTESVITLRVRAAAGATLQQLVFEQAGDYTLVGLGGAEAAASVVSQVSVSVLETHAGAVAMPELGAPLAVSPSDGTFSLAEDGRAFAALWSGAATVDLSAVPDGAVEVAVTWKTALSASAGPGADARIAVKDAKLAAVTAPVPEPSAFAAWALGVALAARRLRRRA